MKKKIFPKTIFPFVLIFLFPFFSVSESPVVENIDYIYLHIGLQVDYPLPESFKNEKLKFEGNYRRYTTAIYRKKTNDIRFTPIRQGSAVMIIKNRKNNKIIGRLSIEVQKVNLHKIAAELRDLLVAIDGIEVKIYNKKVIIDGQVRFPRDMNRIKAVITQAQYTPWVRSLVTYSPEAQKDTAELIEKEIGYPEVTVRYAYNRFLLEGCVGTHDELKRAISIARLYTQFEVSSVGAEGVDRKGVPVINHEIKVPCESEKKDDEEKKKKGEVKKLIQIVVHFVEMEKSFNKGFLFQWSPAIGENNTQVAVGTGTAPGTPRGITAHLTATVSNFFPKLNWAKSFNFARVLHNSSILVENGGNGTISITTTVPTSVNQGGRIVPGSAVSAGVSANIKPVIIGDRNNLVKMGIGISVSSPGAGKGTIQRNLTTVIHVRDGASAVVGGLISSILKRDYNSDPSAGTEAPPIINLYSQKKYVTTKSQFVVFITPLIKSASHLGVERIKKKFKLDE